VFREACQAEAKQQCDAYTGLDGNPIEFKFVLACLYARIRPVSRSVSSNSYSFLFLILFTRRLQDDEVLIRNILPSSQVAIHSRWKQTSWFNVSIVPLILQLKQRR